MKTKLMSAFLWMYFVGVVQLFAQSVTANNHMSQFIKAVSVNFQVNGTMGVANTASLTDTLPITLVENQWDTTNSVWNKYAKGVYYYDGSLNDIKLVITEWNDSANQMLPYGEVVYTYNPNGKLTSEIVLFWDKSTSAYDINASKATFSYDSASNQTTQVSQQWDNSSSAWLNNSKTITTYNSSMKPTQEIYQNWVSSAWTNENKYLYTYDSKGNPNTTTSYTWSGSSWQNNELTTDYRDPITDSLTSTITQYWNGSAYTNSNKDLFSYNSTTGRLQSEIYQYWNSGSSSWVNSENNTFTYDNTYKNKLSMEVTQYWNNYHNAFINNYEILYTYQVSTGILSTNKPDLKTNVYPNPTTQTVAFDYSLTQPSNTELSIYNINGKLVKSLTEINGATGDHTFKLNLTNDEGDKLTKGMYFYKLQAGTMVATGKIIVD